MKNDDTTATALANPPHKPRPAARAAKEPQVNQSMVNVVLARLVAFFSSLRLTLVCLGLGMILIFTGTLAQVDLGLFKAQNEFFRSFFVFWGPKTASWKIPVLPGGYLVGGVLLLNLITAHVTRFQLTRKKAGIWLTHAGLILLLLGQLLTDMLARESLLHLREGEARNYSEIEREAELAIVDTSEPNTDKVVAIPQPVLANQKDIEHPELPFKVRVKEFYPNSKLQEREADALAPPAASRGIGAVATVTELPHVTSMDFRDVPSAVIELITPQGSIGTWLVSEHYDHVQKVPWQNHNYELSLRPRRLYKPYSLELLKFRNDLYAGTEIPKNYSSRVVLNRPDTGEHREVLIYMNNPLRYSGETYYQSGFDPDNHGTILQVVRNPSWLTPYLSCIMVGAGLVVQFMTHLVGFVAKRRVA
jgi:ResB-like family protein